MLSTAAFNALLKTLEEPPPHAVFVLATTEIHKIPATILSRCQRYEFRRIPVNEIVKYLRKMADEEKLEVDEDALLLIARQATGAMRDAISLLDQLASTGQRVTLAEAQMVLGTATSSMVLDLVEAMLGEDAASGMKVIQSRAGRGHRRAPVCAPGGRLPAQRAAGAAWATPTRWTRRRRCARAWPRMRMGFETPRLLDAIRLFNSAATDARSSWHLGLALELALAQAVEGEAEPAPAEAALTAQPGGRRSRVPPLYRPGKREQTRRREGGSARTRRLGERSRRRRAAQAGDWQKATAGG